MKTYSYVTATSPNDTPGYYMVWLTIDGRMTEFWYSGERVADEIEEFGVAGACQRLAAGHACGVLGADDAISAKTLPPGAHADDESGLIDAEWARAQEHHDARSQVIRNIAAALQLWVMWNKWPFGLADGARLDRAVSVTPATVAVDESRQAEAMAHIVKTAKEAVQSTECYRAAE